MLSDTSGQDSDYTENSRSRSKYERRVGRPAKRRKRVHDAEGGEEANKPSLETLFEVLQDEFADVEETFDDLIDPLLQGLLGARAAQLESLVELDSDGKRVRPLTPHEIASFVENLSSRENLSSAERLLLRKLKLLREGKTKYLQKENGTVETLTPLPPPQPSPSVNQETLDALYSIQSTPFEHSFLSRLHGTTESSPPGLLAVDWETKAPWMNLMEDIRDHYSLSHPERELPLEAIAPITYTTLHAYQLPQIHDLLERSFWSGIDVTDSLDYWPERSTVVAMYKKVVIGVAILSSPQQTYIMYLAVKAGWDKAQIARTMLYHLISLNPGKDITLHVSVNNSAMLLYNQFGFKAEEFIAGFYAQYLDPNSRASKNAFRLRLRHQ